MNYLHDLMLFEEVSVHNVEGWVNALNGLAFGEQELTMDAAKLLQEMVSYTIDSALALSITFEEVKALATAIDSSAKAYSWTRLGSDVPQRRSLQDDDGTFFEILNDNLNKLASVASLAMVPGHVDQDIVAAQFRVKVSVLPNDNISKYTTT